MSSKTNLTQAFLSENTKSLDPTTEEQQYVHDVYEKIAQHFSSTRYKPWPVVEEFLKELEIGSPHFPRPKGRAPPTKVEGFHHQQ